MSREFELRRPRSPSPQEEGESMKRFAEAARVTASMARGGLQANLVKAMREGRTEDANNARALLGILNTLDELTRYVERIGNRTEATLRTLQIGGVTRD